MLFHDFMRLDRLIRFTQSEFDIFIFFFWFVFFLATSRLLYVQATRGVAYQAEGGNKIHFNDFLASHALTQSHLFEKWLFELSKVSPVSFLSRFHPTKTQGTYNMASTHSETA